MWLPLISIFWMNIQISEWYENAVAIERGPIVYALKIGEKWTKKAVKDDPVRYGKYYYEVLPTTLWNYGLMDFDQTKLENSLSLESGKYSR